MPQAAPLEPPHDYQSANCKHVSEILSRVGDKWTVLIVMQLANGPVRFNEIKRRIGGISQRMLTLTLRGLERDGIVTRTVTPSIPPRVDYALTDLGRDLLGPVGELGAWAIRHQPCIQAARAKFDADERGR
ncbi:MAG: winged helix-turn-helix transcriptional regulator [Hyphomonadaceae bacterium]